MKNKKFNNRINLLILLLCGWGNTYAYGTADLSHDYFHPNLNPPHTNGKRRIWTIDELNLGIVEWPEKYRINYNRGQIELTYLTTHSFLPKLEKIVKCKNRQQVKNYIEVKRDRFEERLREFVNPLFPNTEKTTPSPLLSGKFGIRISQDNTQGVKYGSRDGVINEQILESNKNITKTTTLRDVIETTKTVATTGGYEYQDYAEDSYMDNQLQQGLTQIAVSQEGAEEDYNGNHFEDGNELHRENRFWPEIIAGFGGFFLSSLFGNGNKEIKKNIVTLNHDIGILNSKFDALLHGEQLTIHKINTAIQGIDDNLIQIQCEMELKGFFEVIDRLTSTAFTAIKDEINLVSNSLIPVSYINHIYALVKKQSVIPISNLDLDGATSKLKDISVIRSQNHKTGDFILEVLIRIPLNNLLKFRTLFELIKVPKCSKFICEEMNLAGTSSLILEDISGKLNFIDIKKCICVII